jgi:single-strand DNA-binding protein
MYLLGNLTRDPELRYAPNGTAVARFGLAVTTRRRQGEDWKDDVCFVDIVAFGRQAETVGEYLTKGRPALVEGRLQWRSWAGSDGQQRSKHEVVAERVQFLSRTPEGSGMPGTSAGASGAGAVPLPEDDDIPFVRADLLDVPPRSHRALLA